MKFLVQNDKECKNFLIVTISMIILEANRQNTPIKGDYQAELSKEDVSV